MTKLEGNQNTLWSSNFGAYFNNKDMSDVVLKVVDDNQSEEFFAHRVILGAQSEVFKKMLFGSMSEANKNVVEIRDTDIDCFRFLLKYIYTGEVDLTVHNAAELVILGDYYSIPGLKNKCELFLKDQLTTEGGLCSVLPIALKYNLTSLIDSCKELITSNSIVSRTEKFLFNAKDFFTCKSFVNLPKEVLLFVLQNYEIKISEEELFLAVVAWGSNQPAELSLKETLRELLDHIRFPILSQKFLVDKVYPLHIVPNERLLEALAYHVSPQQFDVKQIQFQQRRRSDLKVLNRFASFSANWGYDGDKKDCIEFVVDNPISLAGIGALGGQGTTTIKVELTDGPIKILSQTFTIAHSSTVHPLMFEREVKLVPGQHYRIANLQTGSSSLHGNLGKSSVVQDGVKFQFINVDDPKSNGTGTISGQIPTLYYYL